MEKTAEDCLYEIQCAASYLARIATDVETLTFAAGIERDLSILRARRNFVVAMKRAESLSELNPVK